MVGSERQCEREINRQILWIEDGLNNGSEYNYVGRDDDINYRVPDLICPQEVKKKKKKANSKPRAVFYSDFCSFLRLTHLLDGLLNSLLN